MTPKKFVELFYNEKINYFNECFDENTEIEVSQKIRSLSLSDEQKEILKEIIDGVLTDTYYSILLGLDGSANIGGMQIDYEIYDEEGNLLTGCGNIEAEAWGKFHGE